MIPVAGLWKFYPEHMLAVNVHNGAVAQIVMEQNGTMKIATCNVPAQWMLDKLCSYLDEFFSGTTK